MTFWTAMFWACCLLVGSATAAASRTAADGFVWTGMLCLLLAFAAAWCAFDAFGHVRFGWDYHA